MYCVKCGVRLQDGIAACPLCETPVWNPKPAEETIPVYPDRYPEKIHHFRELIAVSATILSAIACLVLLLICFRLYGKLNWGGYPVFGILLGYIIFALPFWFRKPNPLIFFCVDHAAVLLYLLYVCVETGGNWFLPFAFPVVGISLVITATLTALLRYTKGGRFFIFGGLFLAAGGYTMLIEFFLHIAFHAGMFRWSLYSMAGCGTVGLFLLLVGIIRPLREYLNRRFFL